MLTVSCSADVFAFGLETMLLDSFWKDSASTEDGDDDDDDDYLALWLGSRVRIMRSYFLLFQD